MKLYNPLILVVLFFTPILLSAEAPVKSDTIVYASGKWSEIRDKAEEEDKFIMVSFIAEWCYWCKAMEETTFKDPSVVEQLNENFITWRLDADLRESHAMAAKFRVTSYPTMLFFGPGGSFILKETGYVSDAEEFVEKLRGITELKKSDFPDYAFDPSVLDPGFPEFYLRSFSDQSQSEEGYTLAALRYMLEQEEEDLLKEVPWSIVFRFGITSGKFGAFFLDNYHRFRENFGETEAFSHLQKVYADEVATYAKYREEDQMIELVNRLDEFDPESAELIALRYKVAYYMQTGEWKAVLHELEHHLATASEPNLNSINSVCLNIHDSTSDPTILDRAAELMGKVSEVNPSYPHLDTYAALLFRAGRIEEGKTAAHEAIRVGKEEDIDVSDTELLLEIYQE